MLSFAGLMQPLKTTVTKYVFWYGVLFVIDAKWKKQATKL